MNLHGCRTLEFIRSIHVVHFIDLGEERHGERLEPGPLAPESSALTMKPSHLPYKH